MAADPLYTTPGLQRRQDGTTAIPSGGSLDIESGAALKIAGTDKTSTLSAAVSGVAAGYKIARGTLTPDASSKTVATGLSTVVAVVASLKGDPTINMNRVSASIGDQAGSPAAGSIIIKSWKPTATNDATPTAATGSWVAVDWIAIGT